MLTAATAAACTARPIDGGPIAFGGVKGINCVPTAPSLDYTYGFEAIQNPTGADAKITDVSLVHPQGLTLKAAYVAPIANRTLIGNQVGWPPPLGGQGQAWADKRPAAGATVPPGQDGTRNLLLHVTAHAPTARFDGIALTYQTGGKTYIRRTSVAFVIKPSCG